MPVLSLNELRAVMERNGATGFLTKVMVAGALTESSGNTDAVGDGGHSIGIFQLHDQGLGHGMTAAQSFELRSCLHSHSLPSLCAHMARRCSPRFSARG